RLERSLLPPFLPVPPVLPSDPGVHEACADTPRSVRPDASAGASCARLSPALSCDRASSWRPSIEASRDRRSDISGTSGRSRPVRGLRIHGGRLGRRNRIEAYSALTGGNPSIVLENGLQNKHLVNIESVRGWIGRTESRDDVVSPGPVAALSATLDRDDPRPKAGDPLPLLWPRLLFLPTHRQSELGPDGHARLGRFLPPVPLPRRMYAGGRVESHRPLCVGDSVSRLSRVEDVVYKEGRSGPLVFVKVRHRISNRDGLALTEDQDIVYRDDSKPGESVSQPTGAREAGGGA